MIWKKINKIKYKNFKICIKIQRLYFKSLIIDIAKNFQDFSFDQNKSYEIHKLSVKSLGFKNQQS